MSSFVFSHLFGGINLTVSVLGGVFISILLICRFYAGSETYVWVKIVYTPAINLLTCIDPC